MSFFTDARPALIGFAVDLVLRDPWGVDATIVDATWAMWERMEKARFESVVHEETVRQIVTSHEGRRTLAMLSILDFGMLRTGLHSCDDLRAAHSRHLQRARLSVIKEPPEVQTPGVPQP